MSFNKVQITLLAGLLLIASAFGYSVWNKERILAEGQDVVIKLAPVDPRSIMQGDYMTLRYDVPAQMESTAFELGEGQIVYTLDKNNVATFLRIYEPEQALADGEGLLHFRARIRGLQLGAKSFFFQEGEAKTFSSAKYGELKVDTDGHSILVALRGEDLGVLGYTSGLH